MDREYVEIGSVDNEGLERHIEDLLFSFGLQELKIHGTELCAELEIHVVELCEELEIRVVELCEGGKNECENDGPVPPATGPPPNLMEGWG